MVRRRVDHLMKAASCCCCERVRAALNYAVIRGDIEIVKILLENSADPYIENDLGMNAFDICEKAGPFPSVQRVLEGHLNEEQKE